jgi:hypothetical protein
MSLHVSENRRFLTREDGEVIASWFDPRDGSSQAIGAVTAGRHEFQPPGTEDAPDWVLVLDADE